MRKILGLVTAIGVLTGVMAGCGATPAPTEPPPTQTPWIIVVTATPGADKVAQTEPTQTPWIVVATPTPARRVTAAPTKAAGTGRPTQAAQPTKTAALATKPSSPTMAPETVPLKYCSIHLQDNLYLGRATFC
jgi:hypothetical protein